MAALILADSDASGGGDGARQALLSVAGQTLIEYQARSARAAGALHIIVMVDALPGPLVAAFDRLRDEGLSVDVARDVRDAADRVHPNEDLLIFASGVIADRAVIADVANHAAPAVLTLPEAPAVAHHERIDGHNRWAGLALLKGDHLRHTATMLGDWSLGPTLLRVAIQHGAARVALAEHANVTIVGDGGHAHSVSKRLALTGLEGGSSPFERLVAPLASLAAASAMTRPVPFDLIDLLAPALFVTAFALGWFDMPALSYMAFLVGAFAGATASRYGNAAMRYSAALRWRIEIEQAILTLLTLFTALFAWRDGAGWGVNALALWTAANLLTSPRVSRWAPGPGDLALLLLLASLVDMVVMGYASCIAWQLAALLASRVRSALAAR